MNELPRLVLLRPDSSLGSGHQPILNFDDFTRPNVCGNLSYTCKIVSTFGKLKNLFCLLLKYGQFYA